MLINEPTVAKAGELYAGRGVKRMRRLSDNLDVPLYIVSAGLGLVPASDRIPNYDLSVSTGTPSSIHQRITGPFSAADWWASVQSSGFAQPVSKLFESRASGLVLLAVSNAYVPLLVRDLEKLSDKHRARLRLFGSADAKYPPALRPQLMPYDSRLDELVSGSKVDFAQRAAEHFIIGASTEKEFPTQLDKQRTWVEANLKSITPKVNAKRQPVDDTRIRQFARELAAQGLSYTNALNRLRRHHGIACEQSRFRRLFLEAMS